jgi:hypothetical protein
MKNPFKNLLKDPWVIASICFGLAVLMVVPIAINLTVNRWLGLYVPVYPPCGDLVAYGASDSDVLQCVEDHGNPNDLGESRESLIQVCLSAERSDLIPRLIGVGADVNLKFGDENEQLLAYLVRREQTSKVEMLLSVSAKQHRLASGPDEELSMACQLQNAELVKILLRYGFRPDGRDEGGSRPREYASPAIRKLFN